MEKRLENTYCVIMCGGVGSRFWPFSRQDRPKQFIDFFGTGRSLLQTTVDRASVTKVTGMPMRAISSATLRTLHHSSP